MHALCRACAIYSTCPLDWQNYIGQVLSPIEKFTICAGDEDTELIQNDGKFASSSDPAEMWSPTPKTPLIRVHEGHGLCDRGILIPPFISCFPDERLHVWERYFRVLPENPQ